MYGSPETTTGGNALKFYSSVRLDIRKVSPIKVGNDIIGNRTKVKVAKNKIAPPFRQTEFDIIYGEGISQEGEIVDMATDFELIKKSGSWYSYNETKLGQGRESVVQLLKDNPDLHDELRKKVAEKTVPGITG
jgi:recombination protein RecA